MDKDELVARINQHKANIQQARKLLAEARDIVNAQGALELIQGGISRVGLEGRLLASGWYDVHPLALGGDDLPKEKQSVIWTNPDKTESVRITRGEYGTGSAYARVYNGPTGGGGWGRILNDNGNWVTPPPVVDAQGEPVLNSKGKPLMRAAIGEQALVLDDTGRAVPGSHNATHPDLLPDDPPRIPHQGGVASAAPAPLSRVNVPSDPPKIPQQGSVVRGARGLGRALGPIGIALDAFSLGTEVHESSQTGNWDNTIVEGSSIAGGWGGALAGAKVGGMFGAAIGSIFPGPGTAVGLAVGGLVGGALGYWGGSELGEAAAEEATED